MSYLVLARKYRPRTFADVVGQEHVVKALANALDNERLHHAYLFTGTRGVGKTTLARILAACFNCETGITSTPCGQCTACTGIAAGRFMDLIEVDAASRTGVDDTRELLSNTQYLPAQGRHKVYLIDEVHMLTGHSFNALLKTLEEPPEHVKFLLATTEAKKIPVTVLSRCLQFNLKNMRPEVIEQQLEKILEAESVPADGPALAVIARAAAGSMRDALSIADQAISHGGGAIGTESVNEMLGIAGRDEVGALLDALAERDGTRLLAAGDELNDRSLDLGGVLDEMQRAFHQLAMAAELGVAPEVPYERFEGAFSTEDLQLYYQIALMGGRDLEFAPDPKVGFDMTLIRLASFEPAGPGRAGRGSPDSQVAQDGGGDTASTTTTSCAPAERSDGASADGREPSPEWHEIVAAVAPDAGVNAMILGSSNLIESVGARWLIRLDGSHSTLLNDKRHSEIVKALSEYAGHELRVEFEVGELARETPHARKSRLATERQAQAEAVLTRDDNVRELLREFNGQLESAHLLDGETDTGMTG